jgi:hypothetical protein
VRADRPRERRGRGKKRLVRVLTTMWCSGGGRSTAGRGGNDGAAAARGAGGNGDGGGRGC